MPRRCTYELLLAGVFALSASLLSGCAGSGSWKTFRSHNCYNHNGGYRVSDHVNPHPVPITLQECQAKCENDAECAGVLTIHRHAEPGQPPEGPCWLRKDVKPHDCFQDHGSEPWDLHVLEGRGVDPSKFSVDPRKFRAPTIAPPFVFMTSENSRAVLVPLLAIILVFLILTICCLASLVLKMAGLLKKARQPALADSDKQLFAEIDANGDGVITPEELQAFEASRRNCQTSWCTLM